MEEILKIQMKIIADETIERLFKWSFNMCGVFCHYRFFTKKLWRKVEGFKNEDQAEIHCAFMHKWLYEEFDIMSMPIGISWFAVTKDKKLYENYMDSYKPVFDAYEKWTKEELNT